MGLDLFVTDQVLPVGLDPPLTVPEDDVFPVLAHWYGPYAHLILTENIDLLLLRANIPNPKVASLIPRKNLLLIGMYNGTINGFILFHFLLKIFSSQIKNLQKSILTTSIDNFIMWSKTDGGDIAFEMCWVEGFLGGWAAPLV